MIALAVLAVALGLWLTWPRSRKPFDDYVAKLQTAGEPTSLDELWGQRPPDSDNAAVGIDDALKWLDTEFGPRSQWSLPGPWTSARRDAGGWFHGVGPEQIRDVIERVERMRPFYDRIDAALRRPRFVPRRDAAGDENRSDFPIFIDRYSGAATLRHDLPGLMMVRVAAAESPDDRLDACRSLLEIADHVEVGSLAEASAAIDCRMGAGLCIRDAVKADRLDAPAARAVLEPLLARAVDAQVVRGERARVVELIDWSRAQLGRDRWALIDRVGMRALFTVRRWGGWIWSPALMRDQPGSFVESCETARVMEGVAPAPFVESRRRVRVLLAQHEGSTNFLLKPLVLLNDLAVRAECVARIARIALAAAEYRAKYTWFPASTDEFRGTFKDGVPLDPYTDAPFVYEKTANGVRIASAGRFADDAPMSDAELRDHGFVWELKQ